jgi:hypothetical protein
MHMHMHMHTQTDAEGCAGRLARAHDHGEAELKPLQNKVQLYRLLPVDVRAPRLHTVSKPACLVICLQRT